MLASDRLLSVIFGSAIFAAGVAILYKNNSSSGGTTIPPLISRNISISILPSGFSPQMRLWVTMSFTGFFGFEEFLFAILSIVITSIVMNYIENRDGPQESL